MRRFANCIPALLLAALVIATWARTLSGQAPSAGLSATAALDRTVLPIAEPTLPAITEIDARKAKAPPIFEVKAPAGAPNVLVIMLDNFGYAGSTTFGGS